MILLTSQLQRERSIILNTWINQERSQSFSLPFTSPSILETLRESQMQGKCLDPSMKLRLGLSNVGGALIPGTEGQTFLFLQNSIGIKIYYYYFYHTITKHSPASILSNKCNHVKFSRKKELKPQKIEFLAVFEKLFC